MFFPNGIQIVREANPDFVPWSTIHAPTPRNAETTHSLSQLVV
jgi:hypothetical protein